MKKFYVYTVSDCYATYLVEAESKEEAQEKYENGYSTLIGEDYPNEQVNVVEEYTE